MSISTLLPKVFNRWVAQMTTWTSKGGIDDSNQSAKASATNQHRLGGYNYGKLS